mmetsp:Transcript_2537/g.7526  ORF Transcript_2537/g.7526 Transcript_2537/m.7526 type:complete len:318 (-) Transcript_2537:76-1029(-)
MTSRSGSHPQWSTGSPGSGSISDDDAVIRAMNLGLTIFLFVVFMAPIIVAVQIAADFDAAFWIGRVGYLAALLPLVFFILHFLHLHEVRRQRRNPKFVWFIFAIVFPAVLLLVIGGYYMMSANWLYGQLKSDDCSGHGYVPEKRGLQLAYNDASHIYDHCVTRLYIANHNQTLERRPVLQNCREYSRAFGEVHYGELGYHGWKTWLGNRVGPERKRLRMEVVKWRRQWDYLAALEANHLCGGFCERGRMLWSNQDLIGRMHFSNCAPAVALKFLDIEFQGLLLICSQFVILGLTLPLLVIVAMPRMERLGYKSLGKN